VVVAPDTWEEEAVTFLGCSESAPANCKVQTAIETDPLVALLETGTSPVDKVRFKPKQGKGLAVIEVSGFPCPVAGEDPVGGEVTVGLPHGQTESTVQQLESLGSLENNSFIIAGHQIYVEHSVGLLKLASAATWSFH
jgi:hypothetical protein